MNQSNDKRISGTTSQKSGSSIPSPGSVRIGAPSFNKKSSSNKTSAGQLSKNIPVSSLPSKNKTKTSPSPVTASRADPVKKKQTVLVSGTKPSSKSVRPSERFVDKRKNPNQAKTSQEAQKKAELAKAQRIIKEQRIKKSREIVSKLSIYVKNSIIGIIIGIFLATVIFIFYSRSVAFINSETASVHYAFYPYIDPEDETKSANDQREYREKNKESAKIIFKKTHRVINGVSYLPVSPMQGYFNFSISGGNDVRTITVDGENNKNKSSVIFKKNSADIVVNGSVHTLKNAPLFLNNDVYIPFEFFERYVEGISFKENTKFGTKTIGVILDIPRISFKGGTDATLTTPKISDYATASNPLFSYSFDITPYEKYINPADPNKYLTLINLDNRLDESYVPNDLVDIVYTKKSRQQKERIRLDAAKALEALLSAAAMDGITDVSVTSGYRSYEYQNELFQKRLAENLERLGNQSEAEAETAKLTMYPGASEHQSGLCVDMHNQSSALQSFANTEAYSWLYKHCADFGFILRYPKNKESITNISFEPWHFRFVGRFHAQKIMESGLCLEEYIALFNE